MVKSLVATTRRYVMCPPTYFDVTYSVNVWMDPARPTDTPLAIEQWKTLRLSLLKLGHTVEEIDPLRGQPDMVFTANAAVVMGKGRWAPYFPTDFGTQRQ